MPRFLFALFFALALGSSAIAQCRAPRFHKGRDYINPETGRGSLYVSIPLGDFSLDKIICLAQTLRSQHPNWKDIGLLVFSSPIAANNFQAAEADFQDPITMTRLHKQLHAAYFFDADKHEEYLYVMPFGYDRKPYDTRIDLPVATKPHCRFEMNERCLMALDDVEYPDDALKRRISGTVSLTGRIARDGKMTGIAIAKTPGGSDEKTKPLMRAALENLRTWRFEPAQHQDPFRIAFSYEIDTSLPHPGVADVRLLLPTHVSVRENPSK